MNINDEMAHRWIFAILKAVNSTISLDLGRLTLIPDLILLLRTITKIKKFRQIALESSFKISARNRENWCGKT